MPWELGKAMKETYTYFSVEIYLKIRERVGAPTVSEVRCQRYGIRYPWLDPTCSWSSLEHKTLGSLQGNGCTSRQRQENVTVASSLEPPESEPGFEAK